MDTKTGKAQRCVEWHTVFLQAEVKHIALGEELHEAALIHQIDVDGCAVDIGGGE
jgi:hypothetical protein